MALPQNVPTQRAQPVGFAATGGHKVDGHDRCRCAPNLPEDDPMKERKARRHVHPGWQESLSCSYLRYLTRTNWTWEFLCRNHGFAQTTHLLSVVGKHSRRFVKEIASIGATGGGSAGWWAQQLPRNGQLPHRRHRMSAPFALGSTSWEPPTRKRRLAGLASPCEVAGRERWRAGPAAGARMARGVARGRS